ncbi:MAG: hypothetical protein NTZ39_08595 [Methanoregula sp.]|nr:hypothetical protein [Methanoregula sp.]
MKPAIILVAVAVLACCALIAGCTSPTAAEIKPVETPVMTSSGTIIPTSTPEPVATIDLVVTLPTEQFVDLQLTKDRTNGEIHLLYNGGKGEISIQNIQMKVTFPDGTVINQYMDDGKKPRRGDELIIPGTRGSDRCEVYVTSSGTVYKIMDQPLMSVRY